MTGPERDLIRFVRCRGWRAAPGVEVDLDAATGLAAVMFCPLPPDVEHELDASLSLGVLRWAGDFLLTSLVLAAGPDAGRLPALGRLLLGPTVTAIIAALRGAGGHAELLLDRQETDVLTADWNRILGNLAR
jgi:hypothetical protein